MYARSALKKLAFLFVGWMPMPRHPALDFPGLHMWWRLGWLRAWALRPYWIVRGLLGGSRVRLGKRVSVLGRLKMRGPGRVEIGDDVIIGDCCTPYTERRESLIQIHSSVYLNGTRFGCADRIEIGSHCILADCRIMDSDYHLLTADRNRPGQPVPSEAVILDENVWVAGGSAILKGVRIGKNSVIGFGSIVTKSVPENRVFAGNPAKDLGPIPSQ